MNKNKFLNILFFSLNSAFAIFMVFNFVFDFIDLYVLLALFLFLNSVYLLAKFVAYRSDSGLFFGIMSLFSAIFLVISSHFALNFLKLSNLLFLAFIISCLFIFIFFNSVYFLYVFLSNFLIFFPIIFYSFNIIDLKLLFIFVGICVIINVFLYFVLIKSVKRN